MKKRLLPVLLSLMIMLPLFSCSGGSSGEGEATLPQLFDKIGQYMTNGYLWSFDVSGNRAVICNRYDVLRYQLEVVDLSDKKNPQLFATMEIGHFLSGIVIDGSCVYLARSELIYNEITESTQWGTTLQQIDLSTTNLTVLQNRNLPNLDPSAMALYQGYLYLVSGDGLIVIKADEIETYEYTTTGTPLSIRIFIDQDTERAYVSGQNHILDIFDIHDPSNPVLLDPGSVENPYSSGNATSIAVKDQYVALTASGNGIFFLDIGDLNNIELVDTLDTVDTAIDLIYYDHYAFVAGGEDGILTMDITNPENPVHIGQDPTSGASKLKRIGNELFVLDSDLGLIIYDISGL